MSLTLEESTQTTMENVAYAVLRGLIMDAELLPNTHHLETLMASRLGLDPATVHDVTLRLENEGLVIAEGRGGFWISPVTTNEVLDVFGQLSALESRAAYLAATTDTGSVGIYALHDAILTMEDALYRNDIPRTARAVHHFHRSLVQCSGYTPVISAALSLSDSMHRARMIALRLQPLPIDTIQDYLLLVEAIRSGDPDQAYHLHRAYWRRATEKMCNLLLNHHLDSVAA